MLRGTWPPRAAGWGVATNALNFRRVSAFAAAVMLMGAHAPGPAGAKAPGARYCFHGFCHRVGTLAQTDTLVGWRGYLIASYYDDCSRDRLNPCGLTSSGAVFRPDLADNAASPLFPDGTVILAYNPKSGDASVLRITNAGPYSGQRKLDVSRAAADRLGFRKQGVAPLVVSVLQSPTKTEASYVRRREYPSVPGHIGKFETFDVAIAAAQSRFDADTDVEPLFADAGLGAHMGAQIAAETSLGVETGSLTSDGADEGWVPKPRLAVSPSLARELIMLRSTPRPVSRVRLLQGPRLASRSLASSLVRINFAPRLRRLMAARPQ